MTGYYTFAIEASGSTEERQVYGEGEHATVEIVSTAFVCLTHMVDGHVARIEPPPVFDVREVTAAQQWAAGILARLYLAVQAEVEYMGQLHRCDRRKTYFRYAEKPEPTGDPRMDHLKLASAGQLGYEGGDGCAISAELNPGRRVDDPPFMTLYVPANRTRRAAALLARELEGLLGEEGGPDG